MSGWAEIDPAAPHRDQCPLVSALCDFCEDETPATHWEALLLRSWSVNPSGMGTRTFRCDEHARPTPAPNTVTGNVECICLDLASEEEPDPDREHDAGR
jgi:hypothetical protein